VLSGSGRQIAAFSLAPAGGFDITRPRAKLGSKPRRSKQSRLTNSMPNRVVVIVAIAAIIVAGLILLLAQPSRTSPQSGAVVPPPTPSPTSSVQASTTPLGPAGNLMASSIIDTSNWVTYRNRLYGYSFKYPPHWSVSSATDWAQYLVGASSSESSVPSFDDGMQLYINDGSPRFSSEAGFLESAKQTLWGTCLGGGKQDASYTNEVASESTSTNLDGVLYDRLYFRDLADGVYAGISGPLYALDIPYSPSDGGDRILVVIPGKNTFDACFDASSSRAQSSLIHTFIENISLVRPSSP
jgi:hypothetical protein